MAESSSAKLCHLRMNMCITIAFGFVFFSLFAGVFFCMVKSPDTLSKNYNALAQVAIASGDLAGAKAALVQSLKIHPTSKTSWRLMEDILKQEGDLHGARKAAKIASALENPATANTPLYAMPAELRLSLLAMADKDMR